MWLMLALLLFSPAPMTQPGWHTIKDKTGSCQLSVPPTWTVLSTPGHVASPDHMDTTILVGLRAYKPFSDETLKMLADTVFENSPARSFYLAKSSDAKAVSYHVEVPGGTKACVAQISATPSSSRDEIKKIALTLSAVK